MGDLEGRDERRGVGRRGEGVSDAGTYVLFALSLAFLLFGVSVGVTSGVLVPVFVFMFPALVLGALGVSRLQQKRGSVSPGHATERELLSAIRDNGGSITPAEAAMETTLTVREANKMLSELAGGGHLAVESRGGALFYSLAGRGGPELEER